MSSPSLDEVRAELHRALGDERLVDVMPDEHLLRGGLITSIELVSTLVHLENRFKVQLRHVLATQLTLGSLTAAIGGQPGATSSDPDHHRGAAASVRRYVGRPLVAALAIMFGFALLDRAAGRLMTGVLADDYDSFLEGGLRFYPYSGAFAHDDFEFAAKHHQVVRDATASSTWLMFGDSGTIGSYVPADQSLPAHLEKRLLASGQSVRVANLAWFGRLLVKDLMLLELVWERPFDTVIFTLGDEYFDREVAERWISRYRHISVNLPLYGDFVRRVPHDEQGAFREMQALLEQADAAHGGVERRWALKHLQVVHYNPFIQYLFRIRLLPPLFGSAQRWDIEMKPAERFGLSGSPDGVICGLAPGKVDQRQVRILESTISLLRKRGVRSVLYVEPCAPREWRGRVAEPGPGAAALLTALAERTDSSIVDLSWELGAADFIDSLAHYTPEGNRRLASALEASLASPRPRGSTEK